MKKLLLTIIIIFNLAFFSNAQIGGGFGTAFNLGGSGVLVQDVTIDANGDTYFYAIVDGRSYFAAQEIDGGVGINTGRGASPASKCLYGKVSSTGTQTILKIIDRGIYDAAVLTSSGDLIFAMTGSEVEVTDLGNGLSNNAYGYYLARINHDGVSQWIKQLNTGVDVPYGTIGAYFSPSIDRMQVTPDGNIYVVVNAGAVNFVNPPTSDLACPHRIIKLDGNGDEIWHNELFSQNISAKLSVPKKFVANDGSVSFGIHETYIAGFNANSWYFNGEDIYSQTSNYANAVHSLVISLKPDGTKNFTISDTQRPTKLLGVNPTTGDLYITYNEYAVIKPDKVPFSTLPNSITAPQVGFEFSGTLIFNNSGVYQKYLLDKDKRLDKLLFTSNGFVGYEQVPEYTIADKGDYVFFDTYNYGLISFYDQNFDFLKAVKASLSSFGALGNKVAFGGTFLGTLTFGSTTLTQSFHDTDFATRFPGYIGARTDVFFATTDFDYISTPPSVKWLGIDNNWDNTANWSSGTVPDNNTIVEFDVTTAQMPSTASSPTVLKLIVDAGVTASVPSNLIIRNKLVINGTLQINHTGTLTFNKFGAITLTGTGTLSFNGSGTSKVTIPGTIVRNNYADLTLATNENITLGLTVLKKIVFTGTNAIITNSGGPLEIASTDADAISGYSATNYIKGDLTRVVNASGTYVFPISNYFSTAGIATLKLNNLTGVQKITASYLAGGSSLNLSIAGGITKKHLGDYFWDITTDAAPTGGNYEATFEKPEYPASDRYVVLSQSSKNDAWSFEGTTTQTGAVTATAGLISLTKGGQFSIAINSAAVPNGTTNGTTTWTGATNTVWNNADNWSNGIPDGTLDATIPAGLSNYPSIYTTLDNARSLTIASGISGLKLSHVLVLSKGLVNNSDITITKEASPNTYFYVYNGGISGSGKIMFKTENYPIAIDGVNGLNPINNDIEIDISYGNSVNIVGKVGGNINVISGHLRTWKSGSNFLELTNPASTISIAQVSSQLYGDGVWKSVNTTGTYNLYIGSIARKYGEIDITNNNIEAPSVYKVSFNTDRTEAIFIDKGANVFNSSINSGKWNINPTVYSTTGTVDITFKTDGYNNGRASTSDYGLLRRTVKSKEKWTLVDGATITENAGTITVVANGLAPFSTDVEFCIGLKTAATTWIGKTSTDWNTASNWTNGVPSSDNKAIIGNASQYPIAPNGAAAAIIEVAAGSTVSLPTSFYTPNGIVNNGKINVKGSGIFYGFGGSSIYSALSGTGRLVFNSTSPTELNTYYIPNVIDNGIEVDNPSGLKLAGSITINGDFILTKGVVTSVYVITLSNPNAVVTGSSLGYFNGSLKRMVNSTGIYNFPMGNSSVYAPASLNLSGLAGTTDITASFSNAAPVEKPNLAIGNSTIKTLLVGASWVITAYPQPTAGTYDVTLSAPAGSTTANDFYVIKRPSSYYGDWLSQGTHVASINSGGIVTASATGLSSFSQFVIGEGVLALPVKMVKFLATAVAKSAKLYWTTASEVNNDRFEIERREANNDFVKIGQVKGNGTSNQLNNYSFNDFGVQNGLNYYRLKQIDLNGSVEYSEIRSVNFDLKGAGFSVYPNPVIDVINFTEVINSIEVYNLQGALVLSNQGSLSYVQIPSSLTSGVYILKAKLPNGESISKQIIIKK